MALVRHPARTGYLFFCNHLFFYYFLLLVYQAAISFWSVASVTRSIAPIHCVVIAAPELLTRPGGWIGGRLTPAPTHSTNPLYTPSLSLSCVSLSILVLSLVVIARSAGQLFFHPHRIFFFFSAGGSEGSRSVGSSLVHLATVYNYSDRTAARQANRKPEIYFKSTDSWLLFKVTPKSLTLLSSYSLAVLMIVRLPLLSPFRLDHLSTRQILRLVTCSNQISKIKFFSNKWPFYHDQSGHLDLKKKEFPPGCCVAIDPTK